MGRLEKIGAACGGCREKRRSTRVKISTRAASCESRRGGGGRLTVMLTEDLGDGGSLGHERGEGGSRPAGISLIGTQTGRKTEADGPSPPSCTQVGENISGQGEGLQTVSVESYPWSTQKREEYPFGQLNALTQRSPTLVCFKA